MSGVCCARLGSPGDAHSVAGARGRSVPAAGRGSPEPAVPPLRVRAWGSAGCPRLHPLRDRGGIIWLVPQGKMCSVLGICAVCPGSVPAEGWGWDSRV